MSILNAFSYKDTKRIFVDQIIQLLRQSYKSNNQLIKVNTIEQKKHKLIEKLNDRIELAQHAFAHSTKNLDAIEKDIERIVQEADAAKITDLINKEAIKELLIKITLTKHVNKKE